MKKTLLYLLLLTIGLGASAQQDPQYSMYMFNGLAINPAYSGSLGQLSASALYRMQWLSIEGAPKTLNANIHQSFMDNKLGAGLSFVNDKIGVFNRNIVSLAGSYHLKFPTFRLAFGLQANYNMYSIGLSDVQTNSGGIQDIAFGANMKTNTINFGTGAFAYADNWYAGISAPQLLKNAITSYSGGIQKPSYEVQHIFLQGGYIYELNPLIDIKPNALIKYVTAAPLSIDLNVNVYYQKMFGVGLGYRTGKSAIAMLECQVHPWFKIAYAYDRMLSNMGTFTGSTHEFMLRYTMNQKGIQNSPRLY